MAGRFSAGVRGTASRMSHSFQQQNKSFSRYNRINSSITNKCNFSTQNITKTCTMTINNNSFNNNNFNSITTTTTTPICMVYSAISLTSTMQDGTHLIGFGSSSSLVSGMLYNIFL